jgi:DNA-binding NtrC family response regulator
MAMNAPQNVLVVSAEPATAAAALEALAARGARGVLMGEPAAARKRVDSCAWELAMIDLSEADEGGFDLLAALRRQAPETPALLMGPATRADLVVRAMRAGCDEYLLKPLSKESVSAMLDRLMPTRAAASAGIGPEIGDAHAGGQALDLAGGLHRIAGRSRPLLEVVRLAVRLAPSSVPVLITGESGTGKELVSYLVHSASRRRGGPYIRVNCAALSESLLESELFGHERGAFTGAFALRKGRFERAHGGTLLLDEISETTPRLQAKLLRVLEQQDFERVGGSESVHVNVRVVSTSNRDLSAEVEAGRFRRDLYYRLGGARVALPPLRRRPEDIPDLVWHFVTLHAAEARRGIQSLDEDMLSVFRRYGWPGNVRQLRNVVRSLLVLGQGPVLSLAEAPDLLEELSCRAAGALDPTGREAPRAADGCHNPEDTLSLEDLERQAVLEALRRTRRNQIKAARLLGITDRTLREKLRRYKRDGLLEEAPDAIHRAWRPLPAGERT